MMIPGSLTYSAECSCGCWKGSFDSLRGAWAGCLFHASEGADGHTFFIFPMRLFVEDVETDAAAAA